MAGFGAAARASGGVSVVTDTPTTAAGVAGGYLGASTVAQWFDTGSAAFWTLVWFAVLVGIVWALFVGLLF